MKYSVEEIRSETDAVKAQFAVGEGLDTKTFNHLLDQYLAKGTVENGAEHWEKMSQFQQGVFQEIKKSFKRSTLKNEVSEMVLQDKV